jgi:integrase
MSGSKQVSTDREILALKPRDKRYEVSVSDARGLTIRVYPNGERMFEYRYVADNGKRRRMALGRYPALRLGDARNKATKFLTSVIEGQDPSAARKAERRAKRIGKTVGELTEAYFKAARKGLHGGRKKPKRESTLSNEKRLYDHHIAPKLKDEIVTELKRRDIKEFMRDLATDSGLAASSVGRVGEVLSGILAFAVHVDILEVNPVTGLCHPLAYQSRTRRFSDVALRLLWGTLVLHSEPRTPGEANSADQISRLDPLTCLSARLMLITLSRRTEACGARWDEIDRASLKWTVPGDRSKSGRTEVKPLSTEALAIMDAAAAYAGLLFGRRNSEFIFPSLTDPTTYLDPGQVTRAIKRLCKRLEIPHGSPHDFRRSGATTLTDEKYGFPRFIVSKVLGHKIKDGRDGAAVTEIYDLNEYLPQKRAALNAWAGHITALSRDASDSTESGTLLTQAAA